MAKQSRTAFLRELKKLNPLLADAFEAAIQDVRSTAQMEAIEAAIARNDLDGVFQALRLGPEFFAPLDAQIENAFRSGAIWQLSQMPKKIGPEGALLVVRFDQRNPRAERWTRKRAGNLITEITQDQRTLVREAILAGINEGRGTGKIALDLVGRMEGNQRKGGLIGLHSSQAEAVRRARGELSGGGLRDYLRRKDAPERAFVRRVAERGGELTEDQAERIAQKYASKLLRDRGRTIARTEAHNAFSAGRNEAVQQMVESGQVPATAVKLVWQATPSERTRHSHMEMNGQEVPYGMPFTSPVTGAQLMFPGDTSLGAPGGETINCRCGVRAEIDFVALAR